MYDVIIVGGGPAGVFASISAKNTFPSAKVLLLEKSAVLLSKVKISGGGRCNVTHHCFDPKDLVKNYPRGSLELLGPFHRFGPKDTVAWFTERGVAIKTEQDGRMFPTTDDSQTIIDCLLHELEKQKIEVRYRQSILAASQNQSGFLLETKNGETLQTRTLILATGSKEEGLSLAASFGIMVEPSVPSLFTFNIPQFPLADISGVSLERVKISLKDTSYVQEGPILITHFGFSGPAVLKLSAFAARYFFEKEYHVTIQIQWVQAGSVDATYEKLVKFKAQHLQKALFTENPFALPKSLWRALILNLGESFQKKWGEASQNDLKILAQKLVSDSYQIEGKTTHKEEFVTCGGVNLKEVDFRTMESKAIKGLFFAGEVLNIDGITGGFNFQNTWTTGYLAGKFSLSRSLIKK